MIFLKFRMGLHAISDTILNYIPSRLTGLIMIVSAAILQNNWRNLTK